MKTSHFTSEQDYAIGINESDFLQLREIVYQKRQIYLDSPEKLQSFVGSRMNALRIKHPRNYLEILQDSKSSDLELQYLLKSILDQPPHFFEGEHQWAVIKNFVLPQLSLLVHMQNRSVLRMVSLGSGANVEAITLLMLYYKHFRAQFPQLRVEIIALGESHKAHQSDLRIVFSEKEIESIPEEYLQMFFESGSGWYKLKDGLLEQIQYDRINPLETEQWTAFPPFDLVLCRNVLAKFEVEQKQILLENIFHSMNGNGYLFIGPQESLFGVSHSFKRFILNKSVAFRRMPE